MGTSLEHQLVPMCIEKELWPTKKAFYVPKNHWKFNLTSWILVLWGTCFYWNILLLTTLSSIGVTSCYGFVRLGENRFHKGTRSGVPTISLSFMIWGLKRAMKEITLCRRLAWNLVRRWKNIRVKTPQWKSLHWKQWEVVQYIIQQHNYWEKKLLNE